MNPNSSFPKKIRIIYTDPCATDSSSDEEEMNKTKNRIPGINRFVKEITCSAVPFDSSEDDGQRRRKSCTMSTGVRPRPSGKFVAEIRDPFNKKRQWLDTYGTTEEAVAAYQMRKRGYKMMAAEENTSPSSPSSVLDVSVDAIQVEANKETMEDEYVVKKAVKVYKFGQEWKTSVGEEVSVKDLWKGLWEPPSASDSWDELFGRCGLENHMSNLHNHLLLNDNVKLIDLPDMKIDNEDMAWADEILTRK
ncbi:hypothetical protein GQ457_12G007390 [Hibiscus cannabinus]